MFHQKIQTAGYSHRKLAAQTNTSIQGQEEPENRIVFVLVPRQPKEKNINKHQYIYRLLLQLLLFTTH